MFLDGLEVGARAGEGEQMFFGVGARAGAGAQFGSSSSLLEEEKKKKARFGEKEFDSVVFSLKPSKLQISFFFNFERFFLGSGASDGSGVNDAAPSVVSICFFFHFFPEKGKGKK